MRHVKDQPNLLPFFIPDDKLFVYQLLYRKEVVLMIELGYFSNFKDINFYLPSWSAPVEY